MHKVVVFTPVAVIALVISACAGVAPGRGDMATQSPTATLLSSSAMAETQQMTNTQAMTDGQMSGMDHGAMTTDPTRPFDAQFIDSMIEHHQGAIEMAEQALAEAEHPELRQMAEEIIAVQNQEIEQMTTWRQQWYPDLPATGGLDIEMGEMGVKADQSTLFDQRFIEAMISHHQGAIAIARLALRMAEHEEIQMLADAIIAVQEAEIEQMQSWLQAWYGADQ